MITHIVFWKLLDDDSHCADENAARIKRGLEALVGVVPGMLSAQVGRAINQAEYDLCLLSTFETAAALRDYRVNPDHVKVADFVHKAVCARTSLDFESDNLMDSGIDPYVF
jgi:Stress responsive A/B Barrel Domain.